MPISHHVDTEANLLRVKRFGDISTFDEQRACHEREIDPLVVPGIPVLVDCTEVEPPDSTETVRHIADCTSQVAAHLSCGPLAILVASDVEYGMARMYMAYTNLAHPDTEVFRTETEALAWLRLPRPPREEPPA